MKKNASGNSRQTLPPASEHRWWCDPAQHNADGCVGDPIGPPDGRAWLAEVDGGVWMIVQLRGRTFRVQADQFGELEQGIPSEVRP